VSESGALGPRMIVQAPRILFFFGIAILAAGAAGQFAHASDPRHLVGGVLLSCYLAWLFLEARVTFQSPDSEVQYGATTLVYALARLGVVVTAAALPTGWGAWSYWLLLPAAVFAAGVALRLTAIWTLGRWYSHHVRRGAEQTVVTWGPYRFVRHPAYSGMLIAHVGLFAFFLNPACAAFLAALVVAVVWRLLMEERVLWELPGYVRFAEGKHRLVPGAW
jgi:protein-S-isoprenylcysteine O-methyltransferase Ste14